MIRQDAPKEAHKEARKKLTTWGPAPFDGRPWLCYQSEIRGLQDRLKPKIMVFDERIGTRHGPPVEL
jgi:hypothetical protein